MALRPSGMTNDQWKQLSSAMEPNVDDAGKKLAAAKSAQAASISALDKIQNQRSALIRPAAENRLGQTWGAREATAFARDGTGRALPILDKRLDEANSKVESFNSQIQRLQQQSDTNRALASVGATPVLQQPDYGARAQNQASQQPAVAAPKSPTQQMPQRPSPTQTPTSPQTGVGASVGAGGAAPGGFVKSKDKNGNTVYTGTGAYAPTGPAIAGTIGSMQNQNFGNAAVPQAQASIAGPRVASTFGMSVNDPRLNDQAPQSAPIAQPTQNPPRPQSSPFDAGFAGRMSGDTTAIARPGANFRMTVPNGVSYRSADAMAEAYNSREDREARQKVLSDLDSQRFRLEMIAGNPGRRGRAALDALGQNAQQQAALAAGGEKLSADAVQGRASRNNVLANTGMEQSGQTQRQQMAGDVASQGQYLDYDAKNRATNASMIEKPSFITDDQRRYLRVGPDGATPVTDAAGNPIQMPAPAQAQQRDYQAEAFNDIVAKLLDGQRDMAGALPPNAVGNAIAQAQQVQAARQPQAQAPQVGTIKNGYRFKGGNPADQKNWEKEQ